MESSVTNQPEISMEINANNQPEIPVETTSEASNPKGDSAEQRISELTTALKVVKVKFSKYRIQIKKQIIVWAILCLLIISSCIYFSLFLLKENFPREWTWQIGYLSIIRLAIASAIFSLASFCFKTFKSYIHLNEHNTHCITVIDSMANLVGAAKDEQQRNLIYGKLIDIIISFGNTELLSKGDDFKSFGDLSLEAIKKLIEKKT